jgi:transcriptional regulator with XRE-family HTH domain
MLPDTRKASDQPRLTSSWLAAKIDTSILLTVREIDILNGFRHDGGVDDLYAQFGRQVRAARREARLTQQEVAQRVGLTRTSVTNIERGIQHINLRQLYLLASAVGLHPEQLLPRPEEATEGILPERALRELEEDAEGRDFAARVLRKSQVQALQRVGDLQ